MSLTYYVKTSFNAVFLINGAFVEKPSAIKYDSDQPLYVTVLPLKAVLLPYTVKLLGGRVVANEELCSCYKISDDGVLVVLRERHNYVYSVAKKRVENDGELGEFFALVKLGDIAKARLMLTDELSHSLTDEALISFFEPYEAVIKNVYDGSGGYLLLGKSESSKCYLSFDDKLINDITCE